MNEKKIIKKCIKFDKLNEVPWQIDYTTDVAEKLIQVLKIKKPEKMVLGKNVYAYNGLNDFFGNHIAFLQNRAVNSQKEIKKDIYQDEWGVIWDRRHDKHIGTPDNCVLLDNNLDKLIVPDPDSPERYAHFEPIIEANENRYILAKFSWGLFERGWSLRGMENLMIDFMKNPSFIHELFQRYTDFHLKIVSNLSQFKIDGIFFGDDWGCQNGLFFSPNTWREFIKPYLKIMYKKAYDYGYDVFIHSCGDISDIMDDLIEIGVKVFNPFQPEIMNIETFITKYSHKIAFYGGISLQKTLPFGTTAEVSEEIENRISLAQKHSGFIVSPAHEILLDVPIENIITMVERFKSQ